MPPARYAIMRPGIVLSPEDDPVWTPETVSRLPPLESLRFFEAECLDHVIAVNEQHLRRVLGEYVQHYNAMRPHRSLSLDSPEGRSPVQRTPSQRVVSKPVLGGLHHEYRWAA